MEPMTDRLKCGRDIRAMTGPVARNIVTRGRVLDVLDNARESPCTLVCAPAGYGKSLAVASWLVERGLEGAAWVNVGSVADGASSLWRRIVAALPDIAPDSDELAGIDALAQRASAEVPARLARWIGARATETVLVLDDLHGVRSAQIHAQLVEFIAAGVPHLHVVAITRHDPPWPLHRMRADGMIGDVRADVLQFDQDEASALFGLLDVELRSDDIAAVVARTEGWAAGLRLAALGLTGHPDAHRFITEFSGRSGHVADYLMNEVYRGLPPAWQDFLAVVSTVDEVCADLAIALGGGDDSAEILAELARLNAFVHELGDHAGWYRIHPLLLDFLRSRIIDRPRQLLLHRMAAAWYSRQGDQLAALHHALAGEDWSVAADLLSVHVVSWTVRRAPDELLATLADVPREALLTHPGLALGQAAAQAMAGVPGGLVELVAAIREQLPSVDERARRRYEFILDLIEIGLMRWGGDAVGVLEGFRRIPNDPVTLAEVGVADWTALSTLLRNNVGTSELWLGRTTAARKHLEEAADQDFGGDIVMPVLNAGAHLAYLHWHNGDLDVAETIARRTVDRFVSAGIGTAAQSATAYLALAGTALDRDDTDDAHRWLDQAAQAVAEPTTRFALVLLHAQVELADGAAYDAAVVLRSGRSELPASVLTAPLRAAADNLQHAIDAQLEAGAGAVITSPFATCGALRRELDCMLDRCCADDAGDIDQLAAMEKALVIAAGPRLRRPFLDRQRHLRPILSLCLENGTAETEFALDLLGRMAPANPRPQAVTGLFVPLTDRETNVLRYLVSPRTTAEIADALYISVNTVKTHQRAIYRKLGAGNRRGAVLRARELGLI